MDVHPENTLTEFKIKLPQPLELVGEWEVGLAEITYPRRWYNVPHDSMFHFTLDESAGKSWSVKTIKQGYYETPRDLLRHMFKGEKMEGKLDFDYSNMSQKVTLQIRDRSLIQLQKQTGELLGYDMPYGPRIFGAGDFESDYVADVDPVHHLFVYTNIVEDQIVGNVKVPLLRIVKVTGNYGSVQTLDYTNIHYIPLKQKFIDTIEVSVRDDTGNKIQFTRGRVIVKVHFRRRKSPYFH